jgi:hypothetical protein
MIKHLDALVFIDTNIFASSQLDLAKLFENIAQKDGL